MPIPTNCLRHSPGSTLDISSTPKADTASARLKSTQSKSAMYLRLKLNIKLNYEPGVWSSQSEAGSSAADSRPQASRHCFQPSSLRASEEARECDDSNLRKSVWREAPKTCCRNPRSRSESPS